MDSLTRIPWAGRSTLAGLFQRVAANGPNDPVVWKKLVARADVIAHSLTAKQASLVLSALARAQHRNESSLRRFSVKFVPSLVQTAELIDLCGIVSSLSQLKCYREETFDLAVARFKESAAHLDLRQLSLVAYAIVRVGHTDIDLLRSLLEQVPRRLRQQSASREAARDVALLLNALAQVPTKEGHGSPTAELATTLEAAALRRCGYQLCSRWRTCTR